MAFINLKSVLYALLGLLCTYGVVRAMSSVSDFLEHSRTLEMANKKLEKSVERFALALKISEESKLALVEENARIKGLEAEHQEREAQLNQKINNLREESRNEIEHLEDALRRAGVTDSPIPADVIRMQRERAKSINRQARGSGD